MDLGVRHLDLIKTAYLLSWTNHLSSYALPPKGAEPSVTNQSVSFMYSETWVSFSGMHFSGSAPGVDIWKPESQFNNELIFIIWDYIHISLLIYKIWLLNLLNSELFGRLRCDVHLSCLWCQVDLSKTLLFSWHSCSSISRLPGRLEFNAFALTFWSVPKLLVQFHLLITPSTWTICNWLFIV